jgi:hypothetical protein
MLRRVKDARWWPLLLGLALPACGPSGHGSAIGYGYSPVSEGSFELLGPGGESLVELRVAEAPGADCGSGDLEVENSPPPRWRQAYGPGIFCSQTTVPSVRFYEANYSAKLDWPPQSGTYPGLFEIEDAQVEIEFQVELQSERGELTPLPKDGKTQGLEPTSADYYRRYRITAEISCEDNGLPCEGTWKVDVLYDQPRGQVRWLYPIEL